MKEDKKMTQATVCPNADYDKGEDGLAAVIHDASPDLWMKMPKLTSSFFDNFEESVVLLPIGFDGEGVPSEIHVYIMHVSTADKDSKKVKHAEYILDTLYKFTKGFVACHT